MKLITQLFFCLAFLSCCPGPEGAVNAAPTHGENTDPTREFEPWHSVSSAFCDRDSTLWFLTNHEGLYSYKDGQFVHFNEKSGLHTSVVRCMAQDRSGAYWLGTDKGLSRMQDGSFEHFAIPWDGNENLWGEGMNANLVLSLACDHKGKMWLGTWGNGAFCFDPLVRNSGGELVFEAFLQERGSTYGEEQSHRNVIQRMLCDSQGEMWFTSMSHDGIARFDGSEWTHFDMLDGLSDDMAFCIYADSQDRIWCGMLGNRQGALDCLVDGQIINLNAANGLCSSNITTIHEDRNGDFWLGSHRGELCVLHQDAEKAPSQWQALPFTDEHGHTYEQISFVQDDTLGNIWFGGGGGQLFRWDGSSITNFTQKQNP
ncbi:MAG: hypothetical protein KDC12_00915 [Flavobacteriales bacterium]|nr:hypothetical protein [Flavobacteriales bacterium]